MEDDLKILNVEYLRHHSLDPTQDDLTNSVQILYMKVTSNERRPPIEDDLQWKTTIFYKLLYKPYFTNSLDEDDLKKLEDNLKKKKKNVFNSFQI
jgi:hypothetical protein